MAELSSHSLFKDIYISQIEELAAQGLTIKDLAKIFNVSSRTVDNWLHSKKDFRAAYDKGRDFFLRRGVEKSLLKRALGYYYYEIHEKAGKDNILVIDKKVRKHVPADPVSLVFMLTNRSPDRWKHIKRMEVSQLMGLDDKEITQEQRDEMVAYAKWRSEKKVAEAREQSHVKLVKKNKVENE